MSLQGDWPKVPEDAKWIPWTVDQEYLEDVRNSPDQPSHEFHVRIKTDEHGMYYQL